MRKRQQGVALLVVLLIVALISVLATDITSRNQISVRRTINLAEYDQAYWYALSLEQLANKVLKKDLDDSEGKVNLSQVWAQTDVVFPVENGVLAGQIKDMRACFNLNALSAKTTQQQNNNGGPREDPLPVKQFAGLLEALGVEPFTAEQLAKSVRNYIDTTPAVGGYYGPDAEYEARDVPYRAAKTMMNHRSELRAVLGITQKVYDKIAPYVCAIPGNDKQTINVNTIKVEQAPLLAGMLLNRISADEAKNIIESRDTKGYDNIDDFWSESGINGGNNLAQIKSTFTIKSQYFELDGKAKVGDAIFQLQSILQVNNDHYVDVLSRQYGGQK
ncbi:type II secretion system minor pseudopilin GspK [Parashewanella tropica]|uniref:type II secretion system minor pseudopilin GspK n=1 Tax=Parashewanella tropica TaxID=2547970 RepID=UPI003CCC7DC1